MKSETLEPRLFYEGYCQALRDDAIAVGGGKRNWAKEVGPRLFPEKDSEAAEKALDDKLNPNRRDRLSDEQERWIMREANRLRGFSAAVAFICDETNFERPKPRDPVEHEDRLIATIARTTDTLQRALAQLAEIRTTPRAPLQGINGGKAA